MKKIFIILYIITLMLLSISCKKGSEDNGKILVVCTTGMIGDAVQNIAGNTVKIVTLMGSGVDPHLYKAKASDLDLLSNAKVIFYNGLHLEAKLAEILEKFGKKGKKTIAVAEVIEKSKLIKTEENLYDPHVWMAPVLWIEAIKKIKETLIEINPTAKEIYAENYTTYSNTLKKLHKKTLEDIKSIPEKQRVLISAHDAFNYFGKIYGIKVKAIQGISTASEASAGQIVKLAEYIAENKIPAIFLETSVPERTINALKNAIENRGFKVKIGGELYSDAMGTKGTETGTYIGMIKHNVKTIVNGLKK